MTAAFVPSNVRRDRRERALAPGARDRPDLSASAYRVSLTIILILAAGIRLWRLDAFSLWLDEILQSFWAHGSNTFFWKALRFDAFHPPLDYLITRALARAGAPDWSLRLPPVLWGVGTVACMATLLSHRVNRAAGLIVAILLAGAPFHLRYSQEVRPYSLGLFLLSLTLCAVDAYLRRPSGRRLVVVFLSALATMYALYLAAVVLAIAAAGLTIPDALWGDQERRRSARRLLLWSPLLSAGLWLAYLPWWPVVAEASRRPPMAAAEPLTWQRVVRTLAFFAFAPNDGDPLGIAGVAVSLLWIAGLGLALRTAATRFLAIWTLVGFAAIEAAGRIHPHFYATRRFLPAGIALLGLAALALSWMAVRQGWRLAALGLVGAILIADFRSDASYFRAGRVDWRPLARFIERNGGRDDRVFAENQYQQLSIAYYLIGPSFLSELVERKTMAREIDVLEPDPLRLSSAWPPGQSAWLLILGANTANGRLREWADTLLHSRFAAAEDSSLYRLRAESRSQILSQERLVLLKARS